MYAHKTLRRQTSHGAERWLLGAALLVPLAVVFALAQWPATGLASPSSLLAAEANRGVASKRPVASNAAPPPTLVPPTPSPKPTEASVSLVAAAAAIPQKGGTYVVQPGDELEHIAADYDV